MKIEYIGNSEKYLIESIALLFFKGAKFKDDSDGLRAEVCYDEKTGIASAKINDNGRSAEGEYIGTPAGKALSNAFFLAAKELTGIVPPWGTITGIRPANVVEKFLEGEDYAKAAEKMQEEYFCSSEKTLICKDVIKAKKTAQSLIDGKSLSVYIGIPFCKSRCSYCSFVSHSAPAAEKLMPLYVSNLEKEIEIAAKLIKENGIKITSLYVGGGTPTAIPAQLLKRILQKASKLLTPAYEFTVEAGRADTIDREKLEIIKSAGATRLAINPQTLKDETLAKIGRGHTAKDFFDVFYLAREMGFQNINCDLIAGLPDETAEDFKNSLDNLAALSPENITVHCLSLKRAADYAENAKKIFAAEEIIGEMVEYAQSVLPAHGYKPYYLYKQKNMLGNCENVGFAKEGKTGLYNILIMGEIESIISLGAGGVSKFVFGGTGRIERIYNPKYSYEYNDRISEILEKKKRFFDNYEEVGICRTE